MEKIKTWKRLAIALLSTLFVASIAGALSAKPWAASAAESTSDGNDGIAVAAEGGTVAQYNGTDYTDLAEALKAAADANPVNEVKVTVVGTDVHLSGEVTVAKNVHLVLPIDEQGSINPDGDNNNAGSVLAWKNANYNTNVRTMTINEGAKFIINGKLSLGGVVSNKDNAQNLSGATLGKYAQIVNNGKIDVQEGGVLDIYGLVTGTGSIEVQKGAQLLQPFVVIDYSGGQNTLDLYSLKPAQSPFGQYAMVNVQCSGGITVQYGGTIKGHAQLYTSTIIAQYNKADIAVLSYTGSSDKGLIELTEEGSYAEILYKEPTKNGAHDEDNFGGVVTNKNYNAWIGRTKLTLVGGAKANYMTLTFKVFVSSTTVSTQNIFAFPIPYNWDITLAKGDGNCTGNFSLECNFKVMPGASLTVGEGATLTTNGNLYIYDGLIQSGMSGHYYPSAEQLTAAGYNTNGTFIVNGTLDVPEGKTFLGVVQTTNTVGTAKIVIAETAIVEGTIIEGGRTSKYDCNLMEYTTTARFWNKVSGKLIDLEAGKTYVSNWQSGDTTWGVSGVKCSYEAGNGQHNDGAHLDWKTDVEFAAVTGLKGAWMIEHADHNCDWGQPTEEEKDAEFFNGKNFNTITRTCQELGCGQVVEKTLLKYFDKFDNETYNGEAHTAEALFKKLYAGLTTEDLGLTFSVGENKTLKDATTYTITVTLDGTKGYFLVDGEFKTEATFSFTIDPFDISSLSNENYTVTGLGNVTYNGEEQTPNFSLTAKDLGGITGEISFDKDNLVWTANKEAGTASVKVTGNGNFTGELTINFSIKPKEITVTLNSKTHTYDGKVPAPTSVKGTDWTVEDGAICGEDDLGVTLSLKDGGKADVGHYTIVGQASNQNYKVSFSEADLEITQRDISEDGVLTLKEGPFTYNGEAHTPFGSFSLTGFETLAQGTDFKVTYENNTAASDMGATVTVEGTGNFTGSVTQKFTIKQFELKGENTEIGAIASVTYNGTEQQQKPTSVQVTIGEKQFTLNEETDYTVSWLEDCTNAGEVIVTLTGAGNYKGTATTTYQITKAQVTITAENKNSPKGEEIVDLTATVTGLCGSDTFTKGVEYSLSTNATKESDVGSDYTITVTILDVSKWTNYTVGKTDGTYTITAAVFGKVKFGSGETVYDREAHEWTVTNLENADGQEGHFETPVYSYQKGGKPVEEMKEAGEYQVTAELKFIEEGGQTYTTTLTATYTIKKAEVSSLTIAEGPYTYTGSAIAPELTVESKNGLTLTGEEYTVSYGSGNVNAGQVTVTVTGSGNFQGTAQNTFTIERKDIAGAKVSISGEYTYQGSAIVPEKGNVTVTLEGFEVTFDVSASDNTDAGEATLTVTGNGNFQGTAEGRFTIDAKKIAVKIQSQTLTYSGTDAPALDNERWTTEGLCSGDDKASLQVTLQLTEEKERWDAKTYTGVIDGEWKNGNYEVTFEKGDLTINKKNITVTIEDKQSVYGDKYEELTFKPNGDLAAGDDNTALHVTLSFAGSDGTHLAAGDYNIIGSFAEDGNYNVTFAGSQGTAGLYSVKVRPITVKINDQSVLYNGKEPSVPQEQEEGWTVTVGSIAYEDKLDILLTKAEGVSVGDYKITGSISNSNYEVTFQGSYGEEGKFKIEARTVTVVIEDQTDTYNFEHDYDFDDTLWSVKENEGDGLAEGEEKDVLNVILTTEELTHAGEYEITGAWDNGNYAVTFEGSKETKGKFTVEKQDVSEEAIFVIEVEGSDESNTEGDVLYVKYEGTTLTLKGHAAIFEGEDTKTLNVIVKPDKIEAVGDLEVTLTVDDENYSGEATVTVHATDARGYTLHLTETLAKLEELAKDLKADSLKAEDYGTLVKIDEALKSLSEEEREMGEADLAPYRELVDAWNDLADVEDVVKTAKTIADAPISTLFAGITALTALAAAAYIIGKGGIL